MNYTKEPIPPLKNKNLLNTQVKMLTDLLDIELTSKLLLAAHYRKEEINPLEYCFF